MVEFKRWISDQKMLQAIDQGAIDGSGRWIQGASYGSGSNKLSNTLIISVIIDTIDLANWSGLVLLLYLAFNSLLIVDIEY